MKKDVTTFALFGAGLIAALLIVTNLITTPETLWFFYPVFAVAWWPLGVFFCGRKMYNAFSVVGSGLVITFLAVTNFAASPQDIWFTYAIPLVLCWPLGMYLGRKKQALAVAILFSGFIIAYCTAVNLLLTPGYFWAIYPIFLLLWWPLGRYFISRREYRKFSVIGALLSVLFLITCNVLETTYPWALFACFPAVMWPIAMYTGPRLGALRFSVVGAICAVIWYGVLNILMSPASPWIIFVAFAMLWWPLSVYFYGRGKPHVYAAVMSAISIVFFTAVNLLYSPGSIWAVYPVFALAWWPMTLFFAKKRNWFGYSIAGSVLAIAFLAVVNLITSRTFPWSVFAAPCILWWPLSAYYKGRHEPFGYAVGGSILTIVLAAAVNLLASPASPWAMFVVFAALWWPVSVYFYHKGRPHVYALVMAAVSIAFFAAVNVLYSPGTIWAVYPAFAVIWWPLALFFHLLSRNRIAH